jgi:hypothetical protein
VDGNGLDFHGFPYGRLSGLILARTGFWWPVARLSNAFAEYRYALQAVAGVAYASRIALRLRRAYSSATVPVAGSPFSGRRT